MTNGELKLSHFVKKWFLIPATFLVLIAATGLSGLSIRNNMTAIQSANAAGTSGTGDTTNPQSDSAAPGKAPTGLSEEERRGLAESFMKLLKANNAALSEEQRRALEGLRSSLQGQIDATAQRIGPQADVSALRAELEELKLHQGDGGQGNVDDLRQKLGDLGQKLSELHDKQSPGVDPAKLVGLEQRVEYLEGSRKADMKNIDNRLTSLEGASKMLEGQVNDLFARRNLTAGDIWGIFSDVEKSMGKLVDEMSNSSPSQ